MRKGFTLIEMMISVAILSILLLFLYKSYAELNIANKGYGEVVDVLKKIQKVKEVLYLDLALAKEITIIPQDTKHDVVLLQTAHSIHKRFEPYVGLMLKEGHLYRIESLKKLVYPLDANSNFVVDDLGTVVSMRLYKNKQKKELYLLHILFKNKKEIFFKVKALNI